MFDNIIGYEQLTSHLQQLIVQRDLPPVILLSGEKHAGKQTIACEIARAILCDKDGDWSCECTQCLHSRKLTHQNILLLGKGEMMNEIICGRDLVMQEQKQRDVFFFIRAISKLLRRADFMLWESSDVWKRTLKSPSETLREQLLEYQEDEKNWYKENKLKSLITASAKLYEAFPSQMFPVQVIRNAIAWTMMRTSICAKIIIINRIEEMLPASANMLLKTLEEPAENVYFILLSNNNFSILPTIKSRAREFVLPERSETMQKEVLEKVFKYTQNESNKKNMISNIDKYLDSFETRSNSSSSDTMEDVGVEKYAEEYYTAILHQKNFEVSLLAFIGTQNKRARKLGLIFLKYLTTFIKGLLYDETLLVHHIKNMWGECDNARRSIEQKNISTVLVLETLYYTLMENYGKSIK